MLLKLVLIMHLLAWGFIVYILFAACLRYLAVLCVVKLPYDDDVNIFLLYSTKYECMNLLKQTCFSRTLLLTIWLTSSCVIQRNLFRLLLTLNHHMNHHGEIHRDMSPHHTDELDELKAHSNNHRLFEVIDRTDDLIVPDEESFNQACFISRGPGGT